MAELVRVARDMERRDRRAQVERRRRAARPSPAVRTAAGRELLQELAEAGRKVVFQAHGIAARILGRNQTTQSTFEVVGAAAVPGADVVEFFVLNTGAVNDLEVQKMIVIDGVEFPLSPVTTIGPAAASVVRFDRNPCDVVKIKIRHPVASTTYTVGVGIGT